MQKNVRTACRPGFIIRLGIDDLSVVNGSLGMNYGDYLLKETANCIQRAMEPGQKLFRLVSDQFIITDLTGRSMSDASLLYNRIRYEIARWIEAHQYQTVLRYRPELLIQRTV